MVEIVSGTLRVRATIGGPDNAAEISLGRGLSSVDGVWHEVTVTRREEQLILKLDKFEESTDMPSTGLRNSEYRFTMGLFFGYFFFSGLTTKLTKTTLRFELRLFSKIISKKLRNFINSALFTKRCSTKYL